MSLKIYLETLRWQTTVMRDPCNPMRDFKERMEALLSDDKSLDNKSKRKETNY